MFDTQVNLEKQSFTEKMIELDRKAQQDALAKEEQALKNKRKNRKFVQTSLDGLMAINKLDNLISVKVFNLLTREMNHENKIIVSQQTLAELIGVSRQTINVAVKELVNKQLIYVYKTGSSSIYCLNADIVWKDSGDKKETASFRAAVLISKAEQQKIKRTFCKKIETR